MNLRDYYHGLEVARPKPKKQFTQDVADACNVEPTTVRNWVLYGIKPSQQRYIDVLSEKSGIPADKLWDDDNQVD